MSKKICCLTAAFLICLCLFCSGENPSAPEDGTPAVSPPATDSLPSDNVNEQPQATATSAPDPQPAITPPADQPADPTSGTDIIYESETRPPDPASDTDLDDD